MEAVRSWLASVVMVSMLIGVIKLLIPKGSVQKIASFTGGLILLLALLRPLMEIELTDLMPDIEVYRAEMDEYQSVLAKEEENRLKQRIAEQAAAYISDKAEAMGAEVSVRVKTAISSEGIPLPAEAEISGIYVPELAEYIERDLGIPAERQVWCEDKN